MNSKQWFQKYFILFTLFLIIVASFNYFIDPAYIYSKKNSSLSPDYYVKKLLLSENGLVAEGWDERKIKLSLLKNADNFECLVLGSSRVLQISSERNTGNLTKECKNIINVGVSGGSFEDMLTYSKILLDKNNKSVKKVFIEISPWFFKLNMELKSTIYKDYYETFLNELDSNISLVKSDYNEKLFLNLFNLNYFISSLKLFYLSSENYKVVNPLEKFDTDLGYEKAVFLKDGSYVYSKKFLLDSKEKIKTLKEGGGEYKIRDEIYDLKVLTIFNKLINIYRENNIEPAIILTPYHPSVFKFKNSMPYKHIAKIEELTNNLALNNNLELYGSFFPEKIGCKPNEFLDYIHATKSCLDKINFERK